MASAPTRIHDVPHTRLHARLREAEKALKSARARNLRARAALVGSTGAGAAARRMVVELSDREVRQAAAALTAAADAVAALDSREIGSNGIGSSQIPLLLAAYPGPRRITATRADAARTVQVGGTHVASTQVASTQAGGTQVGSAVQVVLVAQPAPPEGPEGAGPLFAWARAHGAAA